MCADVNFTVVDEMFQALETEPSHFGPEFNPVDYIELLGCYLMLCPLSVLFCSKDVLAGLKPNISPKSSIELGDVSKILL